MFSNMALLFESPSLESKPWIAAFACCPVLDVARCAYKRAFEDLLCGAIVCLIHPDGMRLANKCIFDNPLLGGFRVWIAALLDLYLMCGANGQQAHVQDLLCGARD